MKRVAVTRREWLWIGLVDVVFQLTFCLMAIVADMRPRESQLRLELPRAVGGAALDERRGAGALVLEVAPDGSVRVGGSAIDRPLLRERLRAAARADAPVVVRADRTGDYGPVFGMVELVRDAGVRAVSLACNPPER